MNKFHLIFFAISFLSILHISADAATVKEVRDISYTDGNNSDNSLTKLNMFIPENVENPSVLMWVGGGAWAYVDRDRETSICKKIAEEGILTISVGHRLSPALLWEPYRKTGIKHPEHVKDLAKAFQWIYENIDNYGGNKESIFIGGFSSGAQLTTLLASNEKYLAEFGLSSDLICGVIPVAGCYDIRHYHDILTGFDSTMAEKHIYPVFGETEAEWEDASPKNYIDDFDVPMLLMSEGKSYIYSEIFEKLLNEKACPSLQVLNAHKENHTSLWKALGSDKENLYRNAIIDFIKITASETEG